MDVRYEDWLAGGDTLFGHEEFHTSSPSGGIASGSFSSNDTNPPQRVQIDISHKPIIDLDS